MSGLVLVEPDNLIPRPWGGRRLFAYKGLDEPAGDERYGECFEVSCDPFDPESSAHPSVVRVEGQEPELLPDFLDRHGLGLRLLPKTLDVQGLLSVQAHPPGSPEAYYVLDAEPGATMRLGWREDQDPEQLLRAIQGGRPELLDRMNAVEAVPGTMLLNATPDGRDAEVHALGNPEGKAILLLEIRRPGPTFRLWDHDREPRRPIEPERAIEALSMTARTPQSFHAPRVEVRPGVTRTVAGPFFLIEHLEPTEAEALEVEPCGRTSTLHVVQGRARIETAKASPVTLARGRSAVVPAGLAGWRVVAEESPLEIVKVQP